MSIQLTLFQFNSTKETSWYVVNDGVMGGRSQGFVEVEKGILLFTGTLVTQGGGFTSVRADRHLDLMTYDGLELLVRGDGRTFEVGVSDGARLGGRKVSRRAPFATSSEWALVRIPFSALKTTVRGRAVQVEPVNLAKVEQIGFYILDGQDGPFRLEVDAIRAYRSQED